jgi:hypothetical protein
MRPITVKISIFWEVTVALSGGSLPMFPRNILLPSSRSKKKSSSMRRQAK